jgi:hypothetical protein
MSQPTHASPSRSFDTRLILPTSKTAICTAQSVRRDDLDKLALHRG